MVNAKRTAWESRSGAKGHPHERSQEKSDDKSEDISGDGKSLAQEFEFQRKGRDADQKGGEDKPGDRPLGRAVVMEASPESEDSRRQKQGHAADELGVKDSHSAGLFSQDRRHSLPRYLILNNPHQDKDEDQNRQDRIKDLDRRLSGFLCPLPFSQVRDR
jgi:hypothetical protein